MDQISLFNQPEAHIEKVLHALYRLRIHVLRDEWALHEQIKLQLENVGISYKYEYKLGSRNRIDFLTSGGIGIEAKKGKPNTRTVIAQLDRYAEFEKITTLILVVERYMDLPQYVNGKPCFSIGLNKLWGIASK